MMNNNLNSIINWIDYRHDVYCNQKYDDQPGRIPVPYSKHLEAVTEQARQFLEVLRTLKTFDTSLMSSGQIQEQMRDILATAHGHDLIEDARMSYNDVLSLLGKVPADAILALSEYPGKTRDERHNALYWEGILDNPLAAYIKLCDIIANVSWGMLFGGDMVRKYAKEWNKVKSDFRERYPQFLPLFAKLESLFIIHLT